MQDYAGLYSQLLVDLALDISGKDDYPISDDSVNLSARKSLAASFYKKLAPTGNTRAADDAALKKFKAINQSLASGPFGFYASNLVESYFYDYFKDALLTSLTAREGSNFDLEFIRENMGIGPGAAQKADSRCAYTKLFESPMSYTNDYLVALYRGALSFTGFWADAEMHRFKKYGNVKVQGGKIFFAAKNADISRTCCTEPSINMLIQKAVGAFHEGRLVSDFGINLSHQADLNRELARRGSIDGSIATIDLVSASDSIELFMVQRDYPNNFLKGVIMASRCERAVLPDGSTEELNMVSTMGNGFTFPMQTLIFACVVKAVYQCMGIPLINGTSFGVFGDDICVRKEAYEFTCKMLNKLGFSVNKEKSFNTGAFRESCGFDYISGTNVRGVYVKSLETPQQVYSLINRLLRWSARHGTELPHTISWLRSRVRDIRIPPSEADDAGIHVPFELSHPKLDSRYWFKYRYYKRRVSKMQLGEEQTPPEQGGPVSNQSGLAVCFLSGYVTRRERVISEPNHDYWSSDWSLSVSIRDRMGARARYQVATKSIPWWDYLNSIPKNLSELPIEEQFERRLGLTTESYGAWRSTVAISLQDTGN